MRLVLNKCYWLRYQWNSLSCCNFSQWQNGICALHVLSKPDLASLKFLYCTPPFAKAGDIKTHSSVCLSVTKTLTWLITSEVFMIEHWYLACMIIVTSPFYLYHVVTLTFDLSQGQMCCRAGDHYSLNLLFGITVNFCEVPIFVEVAIHEFKYQQKNNFLYNSLEFWSKRICNFCSIDENWYPWKYSHPQYYTAAKIACPKLFLMFFSKFIYFLDHFLL